MSCHHWGPCDCEHNRAMGGLIGFGFVAVVFIFLLPIAMTVTPALRIYRARKECERIMWLILSAPIGFLAGGVIRLTIQLLDGLDRMGPGHPPPPPASFEHKLLLDYGSLLGCMGLAAAVFFFDHLVRLLGRLLHNDKLAGYGRQGQQQQQAEFGAQHSAAAVAAMPAVSSLAGIQIDLRDGHGPRPIVTNEHGQPLSGTYVPARSSNDLATFIEDNPYVGNYDGLNSSITPKMFCSACGTRLAQGGRFCGSCGTQFAT